MTRCPACETAMELAKVGAVDVDGCPTCGGLWLDKGELQLLSNHPRDLYDAALRFRPSVAPSAGASPRRCPRCVGALSPFEFNSLRGIRLDRCPTCDGVFLDHGEAQAIDRRLS